MQARKNSLKSFLQADIKQKWDLEATMHHIVQRVLDKLSTTDDGKFELSPDLTEEIGNLVKQLPASDELGTVVEELMELAYFMDTEKNSPRAAIVLLAIASLGVPALEAQRDEKAQKLADRVRKSATELAKKTAPATWLPTDEPGS